MKRSKFSHSPIVDAVKRVDAGIGARNICRELGSSPGNESELKVCGLKLPRL